MALAYRSQARDMNAPDLHASTQPARDESRYNAYWTRLHEAAPQSDLFHLLRWLDALSGNSAMLGRASHPRDEPVRLGQLPSLRFAPGMVASVASQPIAAGPPRVTIHGLGLFGPNGPLPLHLTEYAHEREQTFGDASLPAFADIFHHRLIALFYRAWADAQAVVDHDRPGPARIDAYVASLSGHLHHAHGADLDGQGSAQHNASQVLPKHALYFQAGHWARQTRDPAGLAQVLSADFGVAARIEEYVVHWVRIDGGARTRLNATKSHARLGAGAVLGRAVRDAQSRFRIVLGPMPYERYCAFLPNGKYARRLVQWVREYVGAEFAWDVRLELAPDEIPRQTLGGQHCLGLSAWLGQGVSRERSRDLCLDLLARDERASHNR